MRMKVMHDYISLQRTKGLRPEEYYEFEFEKRSEEFRRDFLGLDEQRYYLELLNPLKYLSLARNKFVTHRMLENTGVRTSELYGYYQPEARYAENLECAGDLAGVLRILKTKGVQSCVIKTTESSHGDNVWVIKSIDYQDNDAILTRFDGQQLTLSSVLGDEALIFESVVHQTAQFAAFNASSVNTVRFMTALYPDGSAKVIATFMKIGRDGRCVDNAGGGGNVDVCVDVATGEIRHAIQFDGWRHVQDIDCHPDSGNPLNGVLIENWEGIKAEVDRTRRTGRIALIVALVTGIALGAAVTVLAYFFPVKPNLEGIGWIAGARAWLQTYRQYLLIPVAALITALALVLSLGRKDAYRI